MKAEMAKSDLGKEKLAHEQCRVDRQVDEEAMRSIAQDAELAEAEQTHMDEVEEIRKRALEDPQDRSGSSSVFPDGAGPGEARRPKAPRDAARTTEEQQEGMTVDSGASSSRNDPRPKEPGRKREFEIPPEDLELQCGPGRGLGVRADGEEETSGPLIGNSEADVAEVYSRPSDEY